MQAIFPNTILAKDFLSVDVTPSIRTPAATVRDRRSEIPHAWFPLRDTRTCALYSSVSGILHGLSFSNLRQSLSRLLIVLPVLAGLLISAPAQAAQ